MKKLYGYTVQALGLTMIVLTIALFIWYIVNLLQSTLFLGIVMGIGAGQFAPDIYQLLESYKIKIGIENEK